MNLKESQKERKKKTMNYNFEDFKKLFKKINRKKKFTLSISKRAYQIKEKIDLPAHLLPFCLSEEQYKVILYLKIMSRGISCDKKSKYFPIVEIKLFEIPELFSLLQVHFLYLIDVEIDVKTLSDNLYDAYINYNYENKFCPVEKELRDLFLEIQAALWNDFLPKKKSILRR